VRARAPTGLTPPRRLRRPQPPPATRSLLALLAATVLLAACEIGLDEPPEPVRADPTPQPTPDAGDDAGPDGTLRYGVEEPEAIVPAFAAGPAEVAVVDAVFDSLTQVSADLDVEPSAAVQWGSDDEARTWTFVLRRDATFHDGTPVTAADVKFAWELAVREDVVGYHLRNVRGYDDLRAGEGDQLAGVEAAGERVLRVELDRPEAEFPALVAHPALAPVPQEAWERDPDTFAAQPVGNGPFMVAEPLVPGAFLRTARFDDWANGDEPAALSEVLFQFLDTDTAYLAFQQGRLDFTALPREALSDALDRYERSADGYRGPGVILGDAPSLYYLGFDLTEEPFDDVAVRRAVSLSIDRAALVGDAFDDNAAIARGAVPPVLREARPGACRTCRYDPAEAEAIFTGRDIDELTLWLNREGGHIRVARQLRDDLAEVGVRLVLRTEEFGTYLDRLAAGDAGLFRFGWTLDHPTMSDALQPLFHSQSEPSAGGFNFAGYAGVDDLLDEARATLDPDLRRARYREAEDLVLNRDQVIVPLVTLRHRAVVSERVDGLVHGPMGTTNLAEVRVDEE
jgi:oligopeptide transport system substrate-binding protein